MTGPAADLFGHGRVAQGYASSRPRFHPRVIELVRSDLRLTRTLGQALDVGCGTGLSTVPLTAVARRVAGADAVPDMIAHAEPAPGVRYLVSPAECLPLAGGCVDLVTVCGAIDWIDRSRFLPEARRLLPASGWLVVYDGTDLASMVGDPGLEAWHRERYRVRLPRPPRDERPITDLEARRSGLSLAEARDYVLELPFRLDRYADFLLTQSNVTHAVERRGESIDSLRDWLVESLRPLFGSSEQRLRFGGYIWYLRPD